MYPSIVDKVCMRASMYRHRVFAVRFFKERNSEVSETGRERSSFGIKKRAQHPKWMRKKCCGAKHCKQFPISLSLSLLSFFKFSMYEYAVVLTDCLTNRSTRWSYILNRMDASLPLIHSIHLVSSSIYLYFPFPIHFQCVCIARRKNKKKRSLFLSHLHTFTKATDYVTTAGEKL